MLSMLSFILKIRLLSILSSNVAINILLSEFLKIVYTAVPFIERFCHYSTTKSILHIILNRKVLRSMSEHIEYVGQSLTVQIIIPIIRAMINMMRRCNSKWNFLISNKSSTSNKETIIALGNQSRFRWNSLTVKIAS